MLKVYKRNLILYMTNKPLFLVRIPKMKSNLDGGS